MATKKLMPKKEFDPKKPFEFTREDEKFHGFIPYRNPLQLLACVQAERRVLLAMVWFDGEPEMWLIEDNPTARATLHNYYHKEWPGHDIPVHYLSYHEHFLIMGEKDPMTRRGTV